MCRLFNFVKLYSRHLFHSLHGTQFLDERLGLACVIDHHRHVAREQAVFRGDVDASHHELVFLGDDVGDVAHDTNVVVADDAEGEDRKSVV